LQNNLLDQIQVEVNKAKQKNAVTVVQMPWIGLGHQHGWCHFIVLEIPILTLGLFVNVSWLIVV